MTAHSPRADPLAIVRDALERHGCDPQGPAYKFVARCPAHEDRRPSLAVTEGVDGRALLFCRAGCETRAIVAATHLAWSDLFPRGQRHAQPLPGIAPPQEPIVLVLQTLREVGIAYRCTRNPRMWVAERCPACSDSGDRPPPLWIAEDDEDRGRAGRVHLVCLNGCEQLAVLDALAGEDGAEMENAA